MLGPPQKGNVMADRFRNFADMFDGGGMGAAGASFQGSPLSTFANALGIRPAGSEVANPMREVGLMDYFDGGGYGQSGGEFEGSAFSDMMNEMGILPYGSGAPRASERPQMRRPRPTVSYTPDYVEPATATSVAPPAPVTATPLPAAGATPIEQLMMIAMQGLGTNNVEMYGDPLGRGRIIR